MQLGNPSPSADAEMRGAVSRRINRDLTKMLQLHKLTLCTGHIGYTRYKQGKFYEVRLKVRKRTYELY